MEIQEYRDMIRRNYKPRHEDMYTLDPDQIFVDTFKRAIEDGSETALRSILSEHTPGVFTFNMLQPQYCVKLMEEVAHFEKWAHESNVDISRPNSMNHYGAVLDNIGMEGMLDELMKKYISPLAAILYPEFGGATLDSHHGFVVEYSVGGDRDLGYHVDDSEVTLNVCLGKEFEGGELFLRGVRCQNHINSGFRAEEVLDYSHAPGLALIHAGRHRHGAKAITAGHRMNLIVWCRSSVFRQQLKNGFLSWCDECLWRWQLSSDRLRRLFGS